MEKQERINSFLWNLLSILLLFFVIGLVSGIGQYFYIVQPHFSSEQAMALIFSSLILGGFLCSLIIDGSKTKTVIRQRKNLTIRKEGIILSIIAIFLAVMKLWLSPVLTLIFSDTPYPIFFHIFLSGHFGDIVLAIAAALFLIHALQPSDSDRMTQKENAVRIIWRLFTMLCILATVYFLYKYKHHLISVSSSQYLFDNIALAQILGALICSLLLQAEQIAKKICRRTQILFRWELLLLSGITFFFAFIPVWLPDFLNAVGALPLTTEKNIGFTILSHLIPTGYFTNIVFTFSAVTFLLRTFYIKEESDGILRGGV